MEDNSALKKNRLIHRWSAIGEATAREISNRSAPELDQIRLPLPLLGRIPVREMIMFGALHCMYHAGIVKKRMEMNPAHQNNSCD